MVHGNVQANENNLEITKQDWYSARLRAKISTSSHQTVLFGLILNFFTEIMILNAKFRFIC